MSDAPVILAARDIARALEENGFVYAIGGALALAYWGVPRATVDVDIGVSAQPMQLPELFTTLRQAGCDLDVDKAAQAAMKGDFGCRAHGVRVDVFLAVLPLAEQALARRTLVPFGESSVWIVSAEDALLFKVLFGRSKDFADVERLLAVQKDRLDFVYVDRWIASLFADHDPRRKAYNELRTRATVGP